MVLTPLNKLWIPQNDPVLATPAPTLDGFTDTRGTSVVSPSEPEDLAYATGPRIEMSAGAFEDVIFSAIHGGPPNDRFIYLVWIVNSDERFDPDVDCIVVALRPSAAQHSQVDARRLDIKPVSANGADIRFTGDTPPAGAADLGGTYAIRTGYHPQSIECYTGKSGTDKWNAPESPPPGVEARVRSWVLPQPPDPFKWEHGWSVELKLPIDATGSPGWITLEPQFGLYFNVMRGFDRGDEQMTMVQFPWPREDTMPPRELSGSFGSDTSIPGDCYGEVNLPALGGPAPQPQGVKIRRDTGGLPKAGVKRAGTYSLEIDAELTSGPNPQPANDNEFAALLYNDQAENVPADGILVQWQLADWGVNGAPTAWDLIPATSGTNPTASGQGVTVPGGGGSPNSGLDVETTPFHWVIGTQDRPKTEHQCVWIRLMADGTDVNFVEAGLRINMDFVDLSEHVRDAVIGGKGWGNVPRGRQHEFLLGVYARLADVSRQDFLTLREAYELTGEYEEFRFWQWFVKAYRNTTRFLEVNGVKHPVYETAGSFGHLIAHRGLNDGLRFELEGLDELEPGRWRARVATGKSLKFQYRLWTDPERPDEWGLKPRPRPTDVIHDPRFRDAAQLGGGDDEPLVRPPWDPRPYPDPPGQ